MVVREMFVRQKAEYPSPKPWYVFSPLRPSAVVPFNLRTNTASLEPFHALPRRSTQLEGWRFTVIFST